MAGETTKTVRLTARESATRSIPEGRLAKAKPYQAMDNEAITTGELEVGDVVLYDIEVPSNAIHKLVEIYNDDLDSNCAPALTVDVGLFAARKFTSTTSSTDTTHAKDSVLDADALVDGSTEAQSANTNWTALAPDAATYGPDDAGKMYWEILGYDKDPGGTFRVGVTFAAAAATAAAGDLALCVTYLHD